MSIGLTVDISRWLTQFEKQKNRVVDATDHTVKTVAKRLLKKIVEYTPVGNPDLWHPPHWPKGYTPGQLKASWTLEEIDKYEIEIKNSQPYAWRVEYGHWSTQAPEGMMRRAIEEYPILLKRTWLEFKN